MARKSRTNHTHKFIKINGKHVTIWRCALPDCRFLVYPAVQDILQGRETICWDCNKTFRMTEENLDQNHPTCFNCRNEVEVKHGEIFDSDPITDYMHQKIRESQK